MFFSPRKECSENVENRGDRNKNVFSFDSPGSLRDLSSASLMSFSYVMVANVSHTVNCIYFRLVAASTDGLQGQRSRFSENAKFSENRLFCPSHAKMRIVRHKLS